MAEGLASVSASKYNIGGGNFQYDGEVEAVVTRRLITRRGIDKYQQRIEDLVPRYDKCLSCGGDYVEM